MDKLLEYYSKICRVCLRAEPRMDSLRWDDSLPKNSAQISEVIMTCASVQIKEDDGLPSHICKRCMYELQAALKFKLLCETSDVELREHLLKVRGVESTFATVESKSEGASRLTERCREINDETIIDSIKKPNSSLLIYVENEEAGEERLTFDNAGQYNNEFAEHLELAKRGDVLKMIRARQEDLMKVSQMKRESSMRFNGELMKMRFRSSRRNKKQVNLKN